MSWTESRLHAARIEADVQQAVGVVAHPDILDVDEAAQKQARANEQHHRQRGLADEQAGAYARPLDGAFARARLEHGRHVVAARLKHRRDAGEQAGQRGKRRDDREQPRIGERGRRRQRGIEQRALHDAAANLRDKQAGNAAEQRRGADFP